MYCGHIMAAGFSTIQQNDIFIVLGPSHQYLIENPVIYPKGAWITPLGRIDVEEEVAHELLDVCEENYDIFLREHSIEVQIPFIQVINNDAKIIPIHVPNHNYNACENLAKKLFDLSKKYKFSVVASSDFSHYLPPSICKKIDDIAISYILSCDPYSFFEFAQNTTICGIGAITTLLIYEKLKNNRKGIMLARGHSGEIEPMESVVEYVSIGFEAKRK
jgi:AmmeMemoRadiSam system protein B